MIAHCRSTSIPIRHGFSFAEVMFAVVILGIGFIMVAGIFPVALQQTQTSSQQSAAAAFARNAASFVQQMATYSSTKGYNVPPTTTNNDGTVTTSVYAFDSTSVNFPGAHGSYSAVADGLISNNDPRYAFVPFYFRPAGASYAKFYIVGTQSQTKPTYDPNAADAQTDLPTGAPTTFMPKLLTATISGGSPYLITFANGTASAQTTFGAAANPTLPPAATAYNFRYTANATGAIGPGCYVIVANDDLPGAENGLLTGAIYRVGNQRLDLAGAPNEYELVPGNDFVPQPMLLTPPTTAMDVWIVGKQLDPSSGNYSGNVQDLSLYTTFVAIQ